MSIQRTGANRRTDKISINSDAIHAYSKSAMIVSNDPLFLSELAYFLKQQKIYVNYSWTMSIFVQQPLNNIDIVIFSSDAWGARGYFEKSLLEKMRQVPQIYVLTDENLQQCHLSQLANVKIVDEYEALESELRHYVQHEVKSHTSKSLLKNLA